MSTGIQLELDKMISRCLMLIISWSITATASVGRCSVHPTREVIIVGARVLLTCTTHEKDGSIISWRVGKNTTEDNAIYKAPLYTRNGVIGTPEKISDGYSVTHPADNETTLQMKETVLSQAGLYVCRCSVNATAESTVVILDSEPKFTTSRSVAAGESVAFICSVSFNASPDVSCELKIEDASGFKVIRRCESTPNNGLIACNLQHTIIANASSGQWYTCSVALSDNRGVLYSRVLNAAFEWELTSSTADALSTQGMRAKTVIIIAVVVYFIVCSQKRDRPTVSIPQCSMGQPADQSSRCPQKPTNRYDKNEIGSSIPKTPAASCHDDIQQDSKKPKENELIVVENDLYGVTPKQFDPSDGYLTEEPIYHGIK